MADKSATPAPLFSKSTVSLRSIFENINPADKRFLKYVPDGFLNAEQKQAKQEALAKQSKEYAGYGNKAEHKGEKFSAREHHANPSSEKNSLREYTITDREMLRNLNSASLSGDEGRGYFKNYQQARNSNQRSTQHAQCPKHLCYDGPGRIDYQQRKENGFCASYY